MADSQQRQVQERAAQEHGGQREGEDVLACVLGATGRVCGGTRAPTNWRRKPSQVQGQEVQGLCFLQTQQASSVTTKSAQSDSLPFKWSQFFKKWGIKLFIKESEITILFCFFKMLAPLQLKRMGKDLIPVTRNIPSNVSCKKTLKPCAVRVRGFHVFFVFYYEVFMLNVVVVYS